MKCGHSMKVEVEDDALPSFPEDVLSDVKRDVVTLCALAETAFNRMEAANGIEAAEAAGYPLSPDDAKDELASLLLEIEQRAEQLKVYLSRATARVGNGSFAGKYTA